MIEPLAEFAAALDVRRREQLLRKTRIVTSPQSSHLQVDGKTLLAFCSNDYLGLANDRALIAASERAVQRYGVGAAASHLISGHMQPHAALETELAEFVAMPKALLFSTGYMANVGIVTALLGRNDEVFADRLNHASLNDACILARAKLSRFAHGDVAGLEKSLARSRAKRKLIVSDAVFSMDGDLADVPALLALAERHNALLLLDDAHGFGVLGANGRGTLAYFGLSSPRIIYMATLGKALGVCGAFVAAEAVVVETVMQKAHSYVYTTALPPAIAETLRASLELVAAGDARRAHLDALIARLRSTLKLRRWRPMESPTAIQPVVVGSNAEVLAAASALEASGIWVAAIRPPTVPKNSARLRISLSAAHSFADIDRLVQTLHEIEPL